MNDNTNNLSKEDFLKTFKTKKCTKKCSDNLRKKNCEFYHDNLDKRRDPYTYIYSEFWCRDKDKCANEQCPRSNSIFEIQFHPNNYKTNECNQFKAKGMCSSGKYCCFIHGKSQNPSSSIPNKEIGSDQSTSKKSSLINGLGSDNFRPKTYPNQTMIKSSNMNSPICNENQNYISTTNKFTQLSELEKKHSTLNSEDEEWPDLKIANNIQPRTTTLPVDNSKTMSTKSNLTEKCPKEYTGEEEQLILDSKEALSTFSESGWIQSKSKKKINDPSNNSVTKYTVRNDSTKMKNENEKNAEFEKLINSDYFFKYCFIEESASYLNENIASFLIKTSFNLILKVNSDESNLNSEFKNRLFKHDSLIDLNQSKFDFLQKMYYIELNKTDIKSVMFKLKRIISAVSKEVTKEKNNFLIVDFIKNSQEILNASIVNLNKEIFPTLNDDSSLSLLILSQEAQNLDQESSNKDLILEDLDETERSKIKIYNFNQSVIAPNETIALHRLNSYNNEPFIHPHKKNSLVIAGIIVEVVGFALRMKLESIIIIELKCTIQKFFSSTDVLEKLKNLSDQNKLDYVYKTKITNANNLDDFDTSMCCIVFENLLDLKNKRANEWTILCKIRKLRNENFAHLAKLGCTDLKKENTINEIGTKLKALFKNDPKERIQEIEKKMNEWIQNLSIVSIVDLKKYEDKIINEISKDLTECASLIASIYEHYAKKQDESNKEILNIMKKNESNFNSLKNLIELIDPSDFEKIQYRLEKIDDTLNEYRQENRQFKEDILSRLDRPQLNDEIKSKIINMNDLKKQFLSNQNDQIYFRILLLTKGQASNSQYYNTKELAVAISSIHWNVIIDLDPESENYQGLQKEIADQYEKRNISVLEKVPDYAQNKTLQDIFKKVEDKDIQSVQNGYSIFYILPFGSVKRGTYETDIDVNDTYAIFKDFFSKCFDNMDHMKKLFSNVLLNLYNKEEDEDCQEIEITEVINNSYKKALENMQKQSQPNILFVVLENIRKQSLDNLYENIVKKSKKNVPNAFFIINTFEQIILNFSAFNSSQGLDEGLIKYLPKVGNDRWLLSNIEFSTYSDVFEINGIDEGCLKTIDDELRRELTENFLRGKPIQSETIFLQDSTGYKTYVIRDIIREIEKDLNDRITSSFRDDYVRIYHEASAGGSTIGSILLYRFKDKIPSVRLKNLHPNNIEKIVNGIDKLSELSKLPVLILIDLSNKSSNSNVIDELFKELNGRKLLKFIILSVERISINVKKFLNENKDYIIHSKVSDNEREQFNELFKKHANTKMTKNLKYVHLYGLLGFNGNVEIIDDFVDNNLKNCSNSIKTILFLASFVHIHANYALPINLCSFIIEILVEKTWEFFKIEVDKKETTKSSDDDYVQLELISYFLYLDGESFKPYHKSLGESLIRNISNTNITEIKKQFDYFYDQLLSLKIFDQYLSNKTKMNLLDFGSALFINKSSYNLKDEEYFSNLVSESEKELGITITADYIEKIFLKFKKIDARDFNRRLGAVYSRYLFFKKNDKVEGLKIMKEHVLEFKDINQRIKDIRHLEKIDSDLVATYGNLIRHYLNERKTNLNLNQVIQEVSESLDAFEISNKLNSNNPVPIYGEILVRYRLLYFCFHKVCNTSKVEFTKYITKTSTLNIIRESERIIMDKFSIIQKLNEAARDIFWVIPNMLKFRVAIDTNNLEVDKLAEKIQKNVPFLIHVRDSVIALCYSEKNITNWDDLEPKFIKVIIDLSEHILMSKKNEQFYDSNYLDFTLGFIYAQKFPDLAKEYHFERLFVFYENIFKDENIKLNLSFKEIPLSHYFYGVLLMVKAIEEMDEENKSDFIKKAEQYLTKCREMCDPKLKKIRKFNFRTQYRFHLTTGNGLKRLKPLREDEKATDCDRSELKTFSGYLKSYNNAYENNITFATVNELRYSNKNSSDGTFFSKAYFIKEGNKNLKPEEYAKDNERQFNIMLRLDNIYMINLS